MLVFRSGKWYSGLCRAECGCVVGWSWSEPFGVPGGRGFGGSWVLVSSCVGCRRKSCSGSGCALRVPREYAAQFPAPSAPPSRGV